LGPFKNRANNDREDSIEMSAHSMLAFDVGAESGRAMLGTLAGGRLSIAELHRFPNGMLNIHGRWHWNLFRLFEEMKRGLQACAAEKAALPESLAVDTWGVDFSLLAKDGSFLGLPLAYRDPHTEGAMEAFFEIVPRERVYALTGIQFMQFNSLFQLFALKRARSPQLAAATDLLFMPDSFHYLFTGEKKTDFTFATTSQLFNPVKKAWEGELFDGLDIGEEIMQPVVDPGTPIGVLGGPIAAEAGIDPIPVIAAATHDTGSAVAAVPADGSGWAYISSGTWSLMGVEAPEPVINDRALALGFTNEGGVDGTIRFLKNIMGLWLLQQCRKAWAAEKEYGYDELMEMARAAEPFRAFVDPDFGGFLNPPDMPAAIGDFCTTTGQRAPDTEAAFTRVILESLALRYRATLEQLLAAGTGPIDRIHVIGGGSQNRLLCQFTANATGRRVIAGPVEATAIGNLLVQAMALGHIGSLAELRAVVARSFEPEHYEPAETGRWNEAYERFKKIVGKGD